MLNRKDSGTNNGGKSQVVQQCQIFKSYLDMPVWQLRHLQVSRYLEKYDIRKILDIGCAEGTLINRLSRSNQIQLLVGIDLDLKVLETASGNVQPEMIQQNIGYHRENPLIVELYNINALQPYPIHCLSQIQLITMIQFIQHIHLQNLPILMKQVFKTIQPKYVMITTPNEQFNVHFNFKPGQMRHSQHIFQWTRKEFNTFCTGIQQEFGYSFEIFGIGEHVQNKELGYCSQGAFFIRNLQTNKQGQHKMESQCPGSHFVKPFVKYRYPHWQDRLAQKIQNQIAAIIYKNNYTSPKQISQLFLSSKIGKKIVQELQSQHSPFKMSIKQRISQKFNFKWGDKFKDEKDKQLFDEQWIIEAVKKIKYCGYNKERNEIYYQYERSDFEQDMLDQENHQNQQSKSENKQQVSYI